MSSLPTPPAGGFGRRARIKKKVFSESRESGILFFWEKYSKIKIHVARCMMTLCF